MTLIAILGSFGLGWCVVFAPPAPREIIFLVAVEDARLSEPIDFEEVARYVPTPGMRELCALDHGDDPPEGGVVFVKVVGDIMEEAGRRAPFMKESP